MWQMFLDGESWEPFLEKLEGWPGEPGKQGLLCAAPSCHPRGWITPASLAPSIFLAAGSRVWIIPSLAGSPAACQSRESRLRLAGVVAPAWLSPSRCSCSSEAPAPLSHTPSVRRLSLLALPHPAPSTLGKRESAPRLPDLDISEGTGHHGPPFVHMLLL